MGQTLKQEIEDLVTESSKPLTADEACKYLDISKSYLYKLTHLKLLPFYKPSGKKLFFKVGELQQWLLQNPIKTMEEIEKEAISHVNKKPLSKAMKKKVGVK